MASGLWPAVQHVYSCQNFAVGCSHTVEEADNQVYPEVVVIGGKKSTAYPLPSYEVTTAYNCNGGTDKTHIAVCNM